MYKKIAKLRKKLKRKKIRCDVEIGWGICLLGKGFPVALQHHHFMRFIFSLTLSNRHFTRLVGAVAGASHLSKPTELHKFFSWSQGVFLYHESYTFCQFCQFAKEAIALFLYTFSSYIIMGWTFFGTSEGTLLLMIRVWLPLSTALSKILTFTTN